MDYVLLSPNDGELLKKAHQMLLEGGAKHCGNIKEFHPDFSNDLTVDEGRSVWYYALIVYDDLDMAFMNHEGVFESIKITLTHENLTESVNTVLAAYREAQTVQS